MDRIAAMMRRCLATAIAFSISWMSVTMPSAAIAGEPGKGPLRFSLSTLVYGNAQHPAHSTQNPDNAFLNLDRYSTDLSVRPDVFLELPSVSAVMKPRFTASYRWWEDGPSQGSTDKAVRTFVNEWRVQVQPRDTVFLSFGKEKLLWGPSFIASPSNALFRDTERVNPKTEVEGKYLAKAVVVPDALLTFTVITATQQEQNELGATARPLRLIKADLMGGSYLVSLIGYHRRGDRFRLGSFGQVTASDALLLYYDGLLTKGSDVWYPVQDPLDPFGASFVRKYEASGRMLTTVAAGGSYTFLSGSTLSIEFLYNGHGYTDAEAAAYYGLRRAASDHLFDAAPLSGLSRSRLATALYPGMQYLRRSYAMGQYQLREIANVLDVVLRYTHSLDEQAGQAETILEWRMTDRIQIFNINTLASDPDRESEFSAVADWSCMAGIEARF